MGNRGLLRTRILGTLGLLLVSVLSWFFVISPRLEEPGLLEATANSATDQSAALKSQVSLLEQQEKALPQAEAAVDSIAKRFTPSPDVPSLIEQIESSASRASMNPDQILSIVPTAPVLTVAAAPVAPPAPTDGATPDPNASASAAAAAAPRATTVQTARMDVKISVKGTYQQITDFLIQLQTADRVVILDNVSITSIAADTAGTTVTNPDGTTTTLPPVQTDPMYQVEITAHVILIQTIPSVRNDIPQNPNGGTANPSEEATENPAQPTDTATIAPQGNGASPSASASPTRTKKPKGSPSGSPTSAPATEAPAPVSTEQPSAVPVSPVTETPAAPISPTPEPAVSIVPQPQP